jgi:hypothetical protein
MSSPSGPLVISAVTGGSSSGLPVGYGDSEGVTGLQVVSSYPSDDVSGGTDGTGRVLLYSYQRANTYSFGETIRNFLMRWDAKAMTSWYGPVDLYDDSGNAISTGGWKPWAWTGAHYESNSHSGIHAHWEVEVPDSTGALQGRLAVPFGNTTTGVIGLDLTTIYTNLANFHVYCQGTTALGAYQEQFLRLVAPAGYEKALEWNDDIAGSQAFARWRMAASADAETGSNAGTNWALYRYSDSGTQLGAPLTIARSTGIVVMTDGGAQASYLGAGTAPSTTIPLLVTGGSADVVAARFLTSASGGGGNTQPIVQAQGEDVVNRAFAALLATDTANRWTVYADGTTQWGTGSANRDVQLQRTAAGQLTLSSLVTPGAAYYLVGGSVLVGGTSVLGDGGAGVLALANAGTAPSANPTGGVVLYSAAGVLKLIGPSGSAATVLTTSSVISGQYLCPPSQYAPASQTALAITSTTLTAFSDASVNTGSFIAPASGSVVVTATCVLECSAAAAAAVGLIAHGGSTVYGDIPIFLDSATNIPRHYAFQFIVTGLTPGSSYNFDLAGCMTATDTMTILATGQSSSTPALTSGSRGGPVTMIVQAI